MDKNADMPELVAELLSSPDIADKIGEIASSVMSDSGGESGGLPMADMPDVSVIMKLLSEYKKASGDEDDRVRLLRAIKPYLKREKAESVEKAIKLLALFRLSPLLGDLKDFF